MARVLIVEDVQSDRVILGYVVKRTGHEVYFASHGEQALEIYVTKGIEIVVTDLSMPKLDGLEFITLLRALFPDTPVIAVSGMGPELLATAKHMGAFVALSKPIDPHELVEALAQAALQTRPHPPKRTRQLKSRAMGA